MSSTLDVEIPGEGKFPTMVEWKHSAASVQVWGDWDGVFRPLNCTGQTHWILLYLPPGKYHVHFYVDGQYMVTPNMFHEYIDENFPVNVLYVHLPESTIAVSHPQLEAYDVGTHLAKVLVPVTFHCVVGADEVIYIEGSWDSWKKRLPMMHSNGAHYLLLSLSPGKYPFKYIVKGERKVNKDLPLGAGIYEGNNILDVKPDHITAMPQGISCMVLNEFLNVDSNQITESFKFNVGTLFGDIGSEVEIFPCTNLGYMLTNGFSSYAKGRHFKQKSWAGTFQPSDMLVIDDKYCIINKEARYPLTRVNLLLDNYQMRRNLLEKFGRNGKYPPHFLNYFSHLEKVPTDFDTNIVARNEYMDCSRKPAALATSSQKMHLLINVAQYFKQLSEHDKSLAALLFGCLLPDHPEWQKTVRLDALMEAVFMDRRKEKVKDGVIQNQVSNTGLELSYFLRVFFVHVTEYTLKDPLEPFKLPYGGDGKRPIRRRADQIKDSDIQYLKSHVESDLITCHYFENCVAELVLLVRKFKNSHPLLQAAWESYTDAGPPLL